MEAGYCDEELLSGLQRAGSKIPQHRELVRRNNVLVPLSGI